MTGRRIAVIGGGISGLTAGYVLSRTDHVTLFEADRRLGGHADTHLVGPVPVDTGFIVYNERTYPLLTRLFAELGVSHPGQRDEHVGQLRRLRPALCGQTRPGRPGRGPAPGRRPVPAPAGRRPALPPRRPRAAGRGPGRDEARRARPGLRRADDLTFGEFLDQGGFSGYFQAHFALPLVAAVWSCPAGTALRYPARYLLAFLANHGMLSVSGAPPWRTVTGGSRCYVDRAAAALACVRLGAPVRAVRRYPDGAEVRDASGQAHQFDAVVIATHPDQALTLLAPATRAEQEVLGAFRYTPNPAVLHTDTRLLPDRAAVRASWNYQLGHCQAGRTESNESVRISYHLNRLQHLPAGQNYVVTLNAQAAVDPDRIISRMDYAHPAYTPASVAAQRRLPELNTPVTAFAGAYHGWGFHEDGCRSGAQAARALGGIW